MLLPLTAFSLAAILTFVLLPIVRSLSIRYGLLGPDVHKRENPKIPKIGGLAVFLGSTIAVVVVGVVAGKIEASFLAFVLTGGIAALIGLMEDYREIDPVLKPILLLAAGAPLAFSSYLFGVRVYEPFPALPFIGVVSLSIIYPFLVLVALSITSNAVNSTDVLNGSMASTSIVVLSAILIPLTFYSSSDAQLIAMALLGALLVFLFYNKYPASIFAGNVGSLYVGSVIGFLSILGRIEIFTLIALMPQILNEFHVLYSLGGIRSGRKFSTRPIILDGELIRANRDRQAPITLIRMIAAKGGIRESDVVKFMVYISLTAVALALVTEFLFVKR